MMPKSEPCLEMLDPERVVTLKGPSAGERTRALRQHGSVLPAFWQTRMIVLAWFYG